MQALPPPRTSQASSRASSHRSTSSKQSSSRASSPGKKKKVKKPKAKTSPTSVMMDDFLPTALPTLAEEALLMSDTLRRLNNEIHEDAQPEPLEEFELLAARQGKATKPTASINRAIEVVDLSIDPEFKDDSSPKLVTKLKFGKWAQCDLCSFYCLPTCVACPRCAASL